MSGFEIAGIVLGSFPILISACEHYKKGFEPLLKWKRFRSDFIGFIDAVDTERLLFDQMLQRFLISTDAVDHDELQRFLANPNYEGWKREDLSEALADRLGPLLPVFNSTVRTMNKLVAELQEILLLKDGEVNWASDGGSRWDYQMKRVQLSFSKRGIKTLATLETHNRKLRELLESNEKLEVVKSNQMDTRWANIFESIRKHAASIHAAIKTGFCCTCPPHWTALRLEQRKTGEWASDFHLAFSVPRNSDKISITRREVILKIKKSQSSSLDTTIALSRPLVKQSQSLESSLTTLRRDVEPISTSTPHVPLLPAGQRPVLSSSSSGTSLTSTRSKFKQRFSKVNFGSVDHNGPGSGPESSPEGLVKDLQTMTLSPPHKSKKQVRIFENCQAPELTPTPLSKVEMKAVCKKIDDLCKTMSNPDPACEVLGYLSDGQREHELHQLYSNDQGTEDPYISLEALLSGQSTVRLSRQQRYKIASILASSLLQLQTTPWLAEKMDKKIIFFYRNGKDVVVEHPYIKHAFDSTQSNAKRSSPAEARLAVRNSLSNLGILLLELCFGQTIESQDLRKPYMGPDGNPNEFTDYMTARDWAEFVDQEEPAFEQIVKCCVFCIFDEKADWENKKFTQAVHASVVAPLEKLHRKWPTIKSA